MQESAEVLDHFENPRNVGSFPDGTPGVGTGESGWVAEADFIRIQVRVEADRIAATRFKAFGCASAIACGSLVSERARGLTTGEARGFDPGEVARALKLAPDKERYARLAVAALNAAIEDRERKAAGG